ncbi:hypothetical protein AB1Y20_015993 [Prymnesium parvum]|uniref:Trichome birefringence-like C-terminal domain-containing protein n=1 Tax=Prymnesium parvum TaxID=97485 RepID=A0AB34K253_PRYPA
MAGGGCFERCASCNSHTRGHWEPRARPPPYTLNHSLWAQLGLSPIARSAASHYGRCDEQTRPSGKPRALYEWAARHCELAHVEPARVCSVLAGKQVVIAGDSTAGQLFLSFVLLLGGRFGRNSRRTSAISDIGASVCAGRTRVVFVRNDLLLWTDHRSEYNRARACDPLLKADSFMQRAARDADILVLQAGHHFPASLEAASTSSPPGLERSRRAFFTRSLNQTLMALRTARAAWGFAPESLVLMGSATPVPGCSRWRQPLESINEWLAADSEPTLLAKYESRWTEMARLDKLAEYMALSVGAAYVEIGALSALRPDGAMARFTNKACGGGGGGAPRRLRLSRRRRGGAQAGSAEEDCLHSCLPGPVDTWTRLLLNLITQRRAAMREGSALTGRRFFQASEEAWHTERHASSRPESCQPRGLRCERGFVAKSWWWPFRNCSSKRRVVKLCSGGACAEAEVSKLRGKAPLSICQDGRCTNITLRSELRSAARDGVDEHEAEQS